MKLVCMKELLEIASKENKAIAAINVSNMETIMALLEVAQIKSEEIIIQVAPIQLEIQRISYKQIVELVNLFLKDYHVKAALHLDHATTVEDCYKAIDAGFTSVMFDGSLGSYDENVVKSKKVVAYAKSFGVTVEAELGTIGGAEGQNDADHDSQLTDPKQVEAFIKATGVDCLAIAIGNAHGMYKGTPKFDFKRLKEINEIAGIPLVLHGGTGISSGDIHKAIERGIRKINFYTEVDRSYVQGFVKAYEADKDIYMMAASENGRQYMMKEIESKIDLCSRVENLK